MSAYAVRVVPFGGPATQIAERAPDSVSAITRALQRLYPHGDPHGFVAVVSRADDGHACTACRCAEAGIDRDGAEVPS